jgi:hypothetical protein
MVGSLVYALGMTPEEVLVVRRKDIVHEIALREAIPEEEGMGAQTQFTTNCGVMISIPNAKLDPTHPWWRQDQVKNCPDC